MMFVMLLIEVSQMSHLVGKTQSDLLQGGV